MTNETLTKEVGESRKWNLWMWIGATLLGLIILSLFVPIYGTPSERSLRTMSLAKGKGIFPAIVMFAGDNEGRMPESLETLYPDYLDIPLDAIRPQDGDQESPSKYDWRYYPQPKIDDANPDDIVLASSNIYKSKRGPEKWRIVIRADGSGAAISELDYQRQITAQLAKQPTPSRPK